MTFSLFAGLFAKFEGLLVNSKEQLTDIQPIGWFVIEEKPTTFVLGVFILCKFLQSMDKPSRKLIKCHPNVTRALEQDWSYY